MADKNFSKKVLKIVSSIPRGKVLTYGEVARRGGKPRASRAVGKILNANPNPVVIPCHRVVKSDFTVGGYSQGVKKKIKLLKSEGVEIMKIGGVWKVKCK